MVLFILESICRYIFWSDWGAKAKIERAAMDGQGRIIIVSDPKYVAWPNGVTLDLVKEQIYWADAKLRHIMRSDYNGENVFTVVSSSKDLVHPFGLTVFEDRIYWSDWETEGIHYANKYDGREPSVMAKYIFGTTTIRIYQKEVQPVGKRQQI